MTEPRRPRRAGPGARLYVRIYLALLASLFSATILFAMVHMHYYADMPHGVLRLGRHGALLLALLIIALVVAIGAYPVVRRLTRRLERLQASVEAWGKGDLAIRVAVEGRDEVAGLAISFNQAASRVEALMRAQKSLLANASHELRSPLTRIRMAVELLQEQAPAAIREELARDIAELDQLVGELLLASRLDAASVPAAPLVPLDLAALAAEECARVAADCTADPVNFTGDAALLRRMIRNLLENGRRHGGGAAVTLTLAQFSPSEIRLEVSDGGPGVPEQEREAIFEPFYRVRGASEADGGYGLGLSLVRQIARRHGGDASCVAREDGGCVFRVTLPAG
jgi:two-component system OmpR family sensor kinase